MPYFLDTATVCSFSALHDDRRCIMMAPDADAMCAHTFTHLSVDMHLHASHFGLSCAFPTVTHTPAYLALAKILAFAVTMMLRP